MHKINIISDELKEAQRVWWLDLSMTQLLRMQVKTTRQNRLLELRQIWH